MTKQTVGKGKTLLIDGPARIQLLSGKASVLGALVKPGDDIIVRKGKRMPFEASFDSEVELTLGDSASLTEIDGSSIPRNWREAVDEIVATTGYETTLVMGGVDSGKTSFCTLLANSASNARGKMALIDGDLGQSDLGPPGTVSLSLVEEPIIELFRLRSQDLMFIGVTSPSRKVNAVLNALATLKKAALEKGANFLIINTDGWVEGEDAVVYKVRLVRAVAPDVVVAIQGENELAPILDAIADLRVFPINSPENIKKRDRETRKLLRESAYNKYLKEAKVRSFPLSYLEIEGELKLRSENRSQLKAKIEGVLGREILHCEETSDFIILALEKETDLGEEGKGKLETGLGRPFIWLHEGDEEGILVALKDADGKVLGIGTICSIDFEKSVARIYTPVNEPVFGIQVGMIKLDRKGNEIGLILESL